MDFRRSAQLDDRRRRVLMEEVTAPADGENVPAAPSTRRQVRAYPDGVLDQRQPRITDLVPLRPFWMAVLLLTLLTGVAAIETLYICWRTTPVPARTADAVALDSRLMSAIDLSSRGNLASWYSALLLAAGACGAALVFSIRCHRVDDYRGRYRVWLWSIAALLWGSLDAGTGIHESIGGAMAYAASAPQLADVCWLSLYLVVFGALAIRLGIETWHAVGSFSTLSIAAVLYLVAGMTAVGWLPLPGYVVANVLGTSLTMLAHVTLLAGLVLYARHVHLDAQGKLPLRLQTQGPKPKRKSRAKLAVVSSDEEKELAKEKKPAAKTSSGAASGGTATSASSPQPGARPGPLAAKVAATVSHDEDDDEGEAGDDGDEPLSKSERRRLKKMMRQQRRAA